MRVTASACVLADSESRGPRRARNDRRAVRAARSCDRPRGRAVRPRRDPRRARHQHELHLEPARRGPRGCRRRGVRRGRPHRQRALHPTAPDPDGDGDTGRAGDAAAVRRRDDVVLGHPGPPHLEGDGGADARHPRAPHAGGRTVCRRRLRLEAQRLRRGTVVRGARPQARCPGALERGTLREHDGDDPRSRPGTEDRARRRCRRQAHRDPCPPARRHGRLPATRDAGHPVARRLPLRRGVRPAQGLRLLVHLGVHDDDAHRRLPRRRTPRGDVRDRAGDGLPGRQDRASTRSSCGGATSSPPTSIRTRPTAGWCTTPATTTARPPRPPRCSATTSCGPGRRRRTSRARPSASASASRRTSRCAGWRRRGCWPRSTTRPAAGRPPPCGCCRRRRCRSSPGARRTARATRRRGR